MYQVKIQESVEKQLKKMDRQTQRVIKNWIIKNLVDTKNPRQYAKALKGNLQGIWRYRVGDYRLFATIEDEKLIIFLFDVGRRKEIYRER